MSSKERKLSAIIEFPTPDLAFSAFAKDTVAKCTGNTTFTCLAALLPAITTHIGSFDTAIAPSSTVPTKEKDHRRTVIEQDFSHVCDAATGVIEHMSPDQAAGAAATINMRLKKPGVHAKGPYSNSDGDASGDVWASVKSIGRGAMYYHEVSADGGANWGPGGQTKYVDYLFKGLIPGKTYLFRFRAFYKEAFTSWTTSAPYVVR